MKNWSSGNAITPSTFPGITFHPRRRGFLRKETPRTGIVGWMTFNINYFALSTLSEIIFDDGTGRCLNGRQSCAGSRCSPLYTLPPAGPRVPGSFAAKSTRGKEEEIGASPEFV